MFRDVLFFGVTHASSVAVGHSSLTGPRERNEDFCGVVTPEGQELENKGLVAALGDGLGGHKGGREASEYTVRGLLCDYYATPDTWRASRHRQGGHRAQPLDSRAVGARSELAGMATTLSAVVLRGRRWYSAHIGDSRIYLLRDGELRRMTSDHLWDHPELKNVLARGRSRCTPAARLRRGRTARGRPFRAALDGVWGALPDAKLVEVLLAQPELQAAALTSSALASGGHDNASAVVVEVRALPPPNLRDSLEHVAQLPLPPRLKPGAQLDGLEVEELLHDSRVTLLYRVRDLRSGQRLVLKTLRPECDGDAEEIPALIMEEWRARRRLAVLPAGGAGRRTQLPVFPDDLARGCDAAADARRRPPFHRCRSRSARRAPVERHRRAAPAGDHASRHQTGQHPPRPGRPPAHPRPWGGDQRRRAAAPATRARPASWRRSCSPAPPAGSGHDLYAAGVTLYHLLTRVPLRRDRTLPAPELRRAGAAHALAAGDPGLGREPAAEGGGRDPAQRFETAEEFLLALERGAAARSRRRRASRCSRATRCTSGASLRRSRWWSTSCCWCCCCARFPRIERLRHQPSPLFLHG